MWAAIGMVYGVVSLITFIAYGIDKRRAVRGGWRVPERTLHLLELAGGWPVGLAGQFTFHHKNRKLSYMIVFILIVAAHVGTWVVALKYR